MRGASVAEVTVDGEVRPILADGARTWADVEVNGNAELVSLRLPPVMNALPSWPDDAPMPLVADLHADDHEELPSYDDLFGSTQSAMAFHAEDEPVTPPPPVASDPTLPPPTEGSAVAQADPDASVPLAPAPTQPALGILRLSTGDVVSLDRGVLMGRAPKVNDDQTGPERPHVLRLASPDNDISRNHAEVLLQGWHVTVRDLGSTNGTTVALPGQEPMRLRPNAQQVIEPGTVVTLADEVSFTYEVEA